MTQLEFPDSHHLSAALGWLGLGDTKEACRELKRIRRRFRSHPAVLEVECDIHVRNKAWEHAAESARALIKAGPARPASWILYASAVRWSNTGGLSLAKTILQQAQAVLPREPIIFYDLACYECQSGNLDQARQCLKNAFATGEGQLLKEMALEDVELEPLWPEIADMAESSRGGMQVIFANSPVIRDSGSEPEVKSASESQSSQK